MDKSSKKRKAEDDESRSIMTVHLDNMQCIDRPQPVEGFKQIAIWGDDKKNLVESMSPSVRESILNVIRELRDIFAYTVEEMPGIPPEIASRHLDIKPVKQKLRHQAAKRVQATREEVDKLLKT